MYLRSQSFGPQQAIAGRHAFCVQHPQEHATFAANLNPQLAWGDIPEQTQSLVLLCVDACAPTKVDDVNQVDRKVPLTLARGNFYHWVVVDIEPTCSVIQEGEFSSGVQPQGKSVQPGPGNGRQGVNDYTGWFADDSQMEGLYFGYDGPCPPWNDDMLHTYTFKLFATDLARCAVDGAFTAAQVLAAIKGHVLATAEYNGRYSLNPEVLA